MKGLFAILLVMIGLIGCSGMQIDENSIPTVAVLAEMTSRNIGCEVAISGDLELDRALKNIYDSVEAGELVDDALLQLSEVADARPTLAADVGSLIKLIGIYTTATEEIEIKPIPPEIFDAVGSGYLQGYRLCQGS